MNGPWNKAAATRAINNAYDDMLYALESADSDDEQEHKEFLELVLKFAGSDILDTYLAEMMEENE